MKTARILWLVAFLAALLASSLGGIYPAAAADSARVSPLALEDTAGGQTASFIVVMRSQADLRAAATRPGPERAVAVYSALRQTAQTSQGALIRTLQKQGVPFRAFTLVNALRVTGDRALMERLARHADVAYIASDRAFKVPLEAIDGFQAAVAAPAGVEWNLVKVNADDLWALGINGAGVVYANADTGVQWDHPALLTQYRGWRGGAAQHAYSWWDAAHEELSGDGRNACGYSSPVPCDDYGHGTHTMGTAIGGTGSNQIGAAPGARWMACRNMEDGYGRPSTYLECLDFFLAPWDLSGANPDPTLHADVVGNSYTCPVSELCNDKHVMQPALANLRAAGIFMSVSAGNEGPGCSTVVDPPAVEALVTTVGATDYADSIADFSARGPVTVDGSNLRKPDLTAPGEGVRSSVPGGGYGYSSGTSMSAPLVGGVVTLLWSALPQYAGDVAATETLLQTTAVPLYSTQCGDAADAVPNNVFGYGRVDALAAYQAGLLVRKYQYLPVLVR